MPFVKTMKRINKDGTVRIYYYLAESYREEGKMKTRILKPLTPKEAKDLGKDIVRIQDTPKVVHRQTSLVPREKIVVQAITLAETDRWLLGHGEEHGKRVMAYKRARIRMLEAVNALLEERSKLKSD